MKVGNFRKITKGDIPGFPDELFEVITPLSEQVETLTRACQGNIDFDRNFNSEIRALALSNDTETTITLQRIKGKPSAVFVLWEELFDYTKLAWKLVGEGKITVKVEWDSAPSTQTKVKLLIVGGT